MAFALAAVLAPPPADARPSTQRLDADQRIERVFDLPDRAPYRLWDLDLDLGYLYPVRADGRTTIGLYREGRYVLFAGNRYVNVADDTLSLIAQNIGEDPIAAYQVRRERRLAGLTAAPAGEQAPPAAARAAGWRIGGGGSGEPVGRGFANVPQDTPRDQAEPQAAPVEAIDNEMLVSATVVIALVLAGIRLARATAASGRGKAPRGHAPSNTATLGTASRLRRWVADEE